MANEQVQVTYGGLLRRSLFHNFKDAGLNLFEAGSNQDPDAHLDLTNILPATNGGMRLRWGSAALATVAGSFTPVRTYAYNVTQDQSDAADTTQRDLLIATDNKTFQVLSLAAAATNNPLANTLSATPFTGFGPTAFPDYADVYGVVSRRWFYYSDAATAARKVNPSYTTANTDTNWGIAPPAAYNGQATQANYTIKAVGGVGSGYSASPSVTISGGGGTGATASAKVQNGMITSFTVGNGGSKYTSNPVVAVTDASGFGAAGIAVINDLGSVVAVLPAGPINLNFARTYTYAWKNSTTGHVSGYAQGIVGDNLVYRGGAATVLSPARGIIGDIPVGAGFSQIQVTITPATPIDSQVDTLVLMATADGGSFEKLYEVVQLGVNPANPGTISYTDTLPDTLTDATLAQGAAPAAFSSSPIKARAYSASNPGVFSLTDASNPLFVEQFNSFLFNPYPDGPNDGYPGVIKGYPVSNGNQQAPVQNASTDASGNYQYNTPFGNVGSGSLQAAQVVLTGTFYVQQAGNVTFNTYVDSSYLMAIQGATYVSGPQAFNGSTQSPINKWAWLVGDNNNHQDWHNTAAEPVTVNFPAAGAYNFEIGWATANHDERCFSLLNNNTIIQSSAYNPFSNTYTGLTLLDANLWTDVANDGTLLGIVDNLPPPVNLKYFTLHQGRIFATDGGSLYFSKNIAEVTTSTGLITSKWEEAWPGDNQLPISLGNEEITGLKSDGQQLHIGTTVSIYTLEGDSPINFGVPNLLFQETGVLSHDTWSVVYSQGSPAGYMWVTPDLKVVYSDFNTYNDVGLPIYPLISQWDTSYSENAKMSAFSYGPYNLAVLAMKRRGQAKPELFAFETSLRRWYRWTTPYNLCDSFVYQHPETGFRSFFFTEQTNGTTAYRLLDPSQTTDTGSLIPYSIRTSWLDFGESNKLKVINQMDIVTDDANQTVTLYGARTRTDFDNPTVLKAGNIVAGVFGTPKFYAAGSATACRYLSIQFSNTSPSVPEVLDAYEVELISMTSV